MCMSIDKIGLNAVFLDEKNESQLWHLDIKNQTTWK